MVFTVAFDVEISSSKIVAPIMFSTFIVPVNDCLIDKFIIPFDGLGNILTSGFAFIVSTDDVEGTQSSEMLLKLAGPVGVR